MVRPLSWGDHRHGRSKRVALRLQAPYLHMHVGRFHLGTTQRLNSKSYDLFMHLRATAGNRCRESTVNNYIPQVQHVDQDWVTKFPRGGNAMTKNMLFVLIVVSVLLSACVDGEVGGWKQPEGCQPGNAQNTKGESCVAPTPAPQQPAKPSIVEKAVIDTINAGKEQVNGSIASQASNNATGKPLFACGGNFTYQCDGAGNCSASSRGESK